MDFAVRLRSARLRWCDDPRGAAREWWQRVVAFIGAGAARRTADNPPNENAGRPSKNRRRAPVTLQTRAGRLEDKKPTSTLAPEQRQASIRELMLRGGVDAADIATQEGFEAVCKRELLRLRIELGRKAT
jgi:hypothetical protein